MRTCRGTLIAAKRSLISCVLLSIMALPRFCYSGIFDDEYEIKNQRFTPIRNAEIKYTTTIIQHPRPGYKSVKIDYRIVNHSSLTINVFDFKLQVWDCRTKKWSAKSCDLLDEYHPSFFDKIIIVQPGYAQDESFTIGYSDGMNFFHATPFKFYGYPIVKMEVLKIGNIESELVRIPWWKKWAK